MAETGKFISFEGGEGSGKSTQLRMLSAALTERGINHIVTREPGGTALAEKIRPLLVENQANELGEAEHWHPRAETLLFFAARMQHLMHKIQPALASGKWVLCDRFTDSTLVYQGIGKGLGVDRLQALQLSIMGDIAPDRTFLLDICPELGLQRAASRADKETRFEELDIHFHQALRAGFLELAKADRFTVIDAIQPKEIIHQKIMQHIAI